MLFPFDLPQHELIYVNAKQYRGILRRRRQRAKSQANNRLNKARKPYLHESRHLHALRRARGTSGRFLSKRKSEGDQSKSHARAADTSEVHGLENYVHMNSVGASTTAQELLIYPL